MRAATSILLALSAATASAAPTSEAALEVRYLHSLASPSGVLKLADVKMSWDAAHQELWVVQSGVARVFNSAGMEVFAFGPAEELGTPRLVAALEDGDLVVVANDERGWHVVRCNFRGERRSELVLSGVPAGFLEGFQPDALVARNGQLHLASFGTLSVLSFGPDGVVSGARDFRKEVDFGETAQERERAMAGVEMGGFDVDAEGNVLFTLKTMFAAYVAPPAGAIRVFGKKGSAPGKFQVLGDIGRDGEGNVYVTDLLKCAVIVFDRDLEFVKEFGYRGVRPSSLIGPTELVVADRRVFVGQRANRGVSVFQVSAASTQ